MLVIFAEEVTERLVYTLNFAFKERGIIYQLTNDPIYFEVLEGVKFNYSKRIFSTGVNIEPAELLFSEEIKEYILSKKTFFLEECLSFDGIEDPLASIFYVLCRYEEYTNHKRDKHDRFESSESIQSIFGWLQSCICDRWGEDLIAFIEKKYNQPINSEPISMQMIPTFDIDQVRAFEWKEGVRTWVGKWKDWRSKNKTNYLVRQEVLQHKRKDPFDTFGTILETVKSGFETKVFWLIGDFSKFDRNITSHDQRHRDLIQQVANVVEVGIHPSYKSNSSTFYLEKEIDRMEEIVGERPIISRQHFLKVSIPVTYLNCIHYGIEHDYSMGYADQIGFRAGTARPFYFFDLNRNQVTSLTIHSFCYMDATFLDYLKLKPEECKGFIDALYQEVNLYGGEFIPLWHNESLSNYGRWKGWLDLFTYTLSLNQRNEIIN
jgi:hypothetical protein